MAVWGISAKGVCLQAAESWGDSTVPVHMQKWKKYIFHFHMCVIQVTDSKIQLTGLLKFLEP